MSELAPYPRLGRDNIRQQGVMSNLKALRPSSFSALHLPIRRSQIFAVLRHEDIPEACRNQLPSLKGS